MQNNKKYIILFLVAVFISSTSQILLKKSAGNVHRDRWGEYLNIPVVSAYLSFFVATLLTVEAYKYVPLSMGSILESTGYIWVAIMGKCFLKEELNRKKILGLLLIISGIIVFST